MEPEIVARCAWAVSDLMRAYHDREWGTPLHDDRALFELLTLEGAQAGLSWETILRKRDAYRAAFDQFDPRAVAEYDERRVESLLQNAGIVRNGLKIRSAVTNARAFLRVQQECGSFDAYLWRFVSGAPIRNARRSVEEIPARTALSDSLSKDLLARGFKFVGSTICYAFLQAAGLVDDHTVDCFRHAGAA